MDFNFLIAVIVAVFAIVNPLGNVSFFVALTEGYSHKDRLEVINKAVFVAAGILIIFALVGNLIFEIFSITIPAFRIAGGILLFSIAFSMLRGSRPKTKLTDRDKEEALERQAVGIVPLGIPMLAGPGAYLEHGVTISKLRLDHLEYGVSVSARGRRVRLIRHASLLIMF